MVLSELPALSPAQVVGLDFEPDLRLRLSEMGLRPGARIAVTQSVGRRGRVVAVGADRFALDAATCAAIRVRAVDVP